MVENVDPGEVALFVGGWNIVARVGFENGAFGGGWNMEASAGCLDIDFCGVGANSDVGADS